MTLTPERLAELKKEIEESIANSEKNINTPSNEIVKEIKKAVVLPAIVENVKKVEPVKIELEKPIIKEVLVSAKVIEPAKEVIKKLKNDKVAEKKLKVVPENKLELSVEKNKKSISHRYRAKGRGLAMVPMMIDAVEDKRLKHCHRIKDNIFTKWHHSLVIIILILATLVGMVVVDIFGAYYWHFRDIFTLEVSRVLPLKAGFVNGYQIPLSDYMEQYNLLKKAANTNREAVSPLKTDTNDLSKKIFDRLTANYLIKDELKHFGVSVSNDEIDKRINQLIDQSGGRAEAEKSISEFYNLNLEQFKKEILRPLAEKELLQQVIAKDEFLPINQEAKKRAEEVLLLAQESGANFAALATQYSDDENGVAMGGDLGWISMGEVNADLEKVLFNAELGKVYGQIVRNGFGYHIIKVEEKLTNSVTGKTSVRARHILIKVDVDRYLRVVMDNANIQEWVK